MTKIDAAASEVKPSKYDKPENWKPPAPKAKPKPKNEDELMNDDSGGGFKAKPKGLGVKPKKKVAADAEMADEEKKAPAKRPALSSAKPKTAAASSSKGPTAPVIQEEDLGAGLSKEEAIEKAEEFYSASIIKKFGDAAWKVKVEAFNEL